MSNIQVPPQTQALAFHPLADLFPLIEGKEFDDLITDVRAYGVREPVWLYQGELLDGRNRYRAAQAAASSARPASMTATIPLDSSSRST